MTKNVTLSMQSEEKEIHIQFLSRAPNDGPEHTRHLALIILP